MSKYDGLSILAFDTATRGCSVALWCDGNILASAAEEMERGQSAALMPMVERVLKNANKGFDGLDALAVTTGPGAFTGLRIGLAAARGMALASGLPVFGITTLDVVAHSIPEHERSGKTVLIALETKRADHYVQIFSDILDPQSEPQALQPDALSNLVISEKIIIAGDAALSAQQALCNQGADISISSASGLPDAKVLALRAADRWTHGERPRAMPQPLYLRAPDVSQPGAVSTVR